MPVMTTVNHGNLNPHHAPWQPAAASSSTAKANDAYIQQARSRLRPVSHSSAMTDHSSSSVSSFTSVDSANSQDTVMPEPPTPGMRRPIAKRSLTSPAPHDPRGTGMYTVGNGYSVRATNGYHGGISSGGGPSQASSFYGQEQTNGYDDAQSIIQGEDDEHDEEEEDEEEEDDDGDADGGPVSEEHVVALHDFASSNSTCLSFAAGQIIKVFNRDESGWWDGELNGKRGWFPSNYVDEDGMAVGSPDAQHHDLAPEDPMTHHGYGAGEAGTSRSRYLDEAASGRSQFAQRGYGATATFSNGRRGPAFPSSGPSEQRDASIIEPIQHSIALLRNAVGAGRWPHFQPATACVISSVRSVLSATDCLTRESSTLRAHPILAKERKQVLSELSRLVTQSRRASAVGQNENPIPHEMEMMLTYAQNVLSNTRRFLAVAVECGVNPTDQSQDSPIETTSNRADLDKTPTPGSPRSSYLTARTSDEQSAPTSLGAYGQSLTVDHRPAFTAIKRRQSDYGMGLSPTSSTVDPRSEYNRTRANSDVSEAESRGSRVESTGADSGSDDQDADGIGLPVMQTRDQALERLKRANDHLLSIIAAFVGHIHTHTRGSHASSYAFLIDVTREAVDSVRDLLLVVEGVHANAALQTMCPNEMSILWETRENLYEATTTLVTAARIVTSKTLSSPHVSPALGSDDEERTKLLASATTLLRTGQECVGAVKMCLCKAREDFVLTLSTPSKATVAREAKADARLSREEAEIDAEEERELQEALASGDGLGVRRGRHTLSLLGRKATSLSCLRQRYEAMGSEWTGTSEDETGGSGESGGENASAASSMIGSRKSSLATGRAVPLSLTPLDPSFQRLHRGDEQRPHEGREASDSSETTASRQVSIESNFTTGSVRSSHTDLTAYSSTRPSLDRQTSSFVADSAEEGEGQSMASKPIVRTQPEQEQQRHQQQQRQQQQQQAQPPSPSGNAHVFLEAKLMAPMYDPTDICYNSEGQVTGATLSALVEKMTPHDTTVDASFSNGFFLCFRLFTSPKELFDSLIARFSVETPREVEMNPDAMNTWTNNKVMPIRLRVLNVFKIWLELHWQPSTDKVILEPLLAFISTSMTHSLHRSGQRLAELAQSRSKVQHSKSTVLKAGTVRGPGSLKRVFSSDKIKGSLSAQGFIDVNSMNLPSSFPKGAPLPTPLVSKSLAAMLRTNAGSVNVLDVDPLELARQLTIMESKVFCCILPEELLGQEFSKKAGQSNAVHVKKMSALTTHITGWIAECILGEDDAKKRTQLVKYFIKVGDRCMAISNYNALFAIQSALNTSTITRLRKTWDGVPTKYLNMMEAQRTVIEHTRNFAVYRARLRSTSAPALPFVGLFLTDLTFCHEGNASTRPSPLARKKQLINFDKYMKLSRIVSDLQRFQVPFNLVEVVEIQSFLQSVLTKGSQASGPEELYRRSLWLEPRKKDDAAAGGSIASLAGTSAGVGSGILSSGHGNGNGNGNGSATVNGNGNGTLSSSVGSTKTGASGLDIFNWK